MNSRSYNKLYLPKNREQDNEKLLLGYQSNVTEIRLKKDYETYFHVPAFSASLMLTASSLIEDGAIGGPFPAVSDRIFQSRKNYGNITNNGNMSSSVANGMWFCSWLYRAPDGTQQWMDRFYNPGSYDISFSVEDLLYPTYTVNNPVFHDVPSTLTLDAGVLYRYAHVGEQTAAEFVDTFKGDENKYLVFDLTNWGVSSVDVSQNNFDVIINSPATTSELYPALNDPQRVDQKLIGFNHNYDSDCYISWDDDLAVKDEFSLSFWVRSDNWKECPTTQLAGNFSSKGGFGVFVDHLSSFPLFVVPETNYGHVLIVNENGVGIADKLTKTDPLEQTEFSPKFACVDTNNDIVLCRDKSGDTNQTTIYKINHLGIVLRSAEKNSFTFTLNEVALGLFCAANNDVWVVTTEHVYVFDTNLILKSTTSRTTLSSTTIAFSSVSGTEQYGLVFDDNSLDLKFEEQTKWSIDKLDSNLYKNNELFYSFDSPASNLSIDPQGRIWVLHGTNDVSILEPSFTDETKKLVTKFDVGTNQPHRTKHITFLQTHDRATRSFKWISLIQYADEDVLYMVDMSGVLYKTIDTGSLYRNQILKELKQDSRYFKYEGKGDFTGYEQKRVFKNLSPVVNKQQLILKASLRDFAQTANDYSVFSCSCSIDGWDDKNWQNVVVTYQNKQFKLYVNGNLKDSLTHSGRYGLSFEQQPSWFFGIPVGFKNGFNKEIGHTSLIFNGYLQTIKLYKRCLTQNELLLLLRSNIVAEDVYWTLPTPSMQYLEKIERVFKHKLPGSKSPFYRIKIANLSIEDPIIKNLIEEEVKKIVSEMNPGHADFVEVQWL
jgi:hypothetical protein